MNLYIYNIEQLVTCQASASSCSKNTDPRRNAKHGREAMNEIGLVDGPSCIIAKQGRIEYAGPMSGAHRYDTSDCEQIDATGMCALPGFIDSHTHLVFGGYRQEEFQWRLEGQSYMEIMQRGGGIASTTTATRKAGFAELFESAWEHLDRMMQQGVTSIEAKSGYGMDLKTEIRQLETMQQLNSKHPIDISSTFMGAHDTPAEWKGRSDEYIDYIIREVMPQVAERGLASCCDIFTEKGVFDHEQTRRLLKAAAALEMDLKMHADEIVPFAGAELAAELDCLSADHLLQVSPAGIEALAKSNTVATLLPLTAFSLRADYAPARALIDAGAAVAVASDLNPGSCFSASVPLLIALSTMYMGMSIEETINALTYNAAAAIGRSDEVGSIEPGKLADIVLLQYPSYQFLNYHFGMNIVAQVIKGGELIYSAPGYEF